MRTDDVGTFVKSVLTRIKNGVDQARAAGRAVDYPGTVQFELYVRDSHFMDDRPPSATIKFEIPWVVGDEELPEIGESEAA